MQEQEEASWEGNCLDGAPFALLNLLPTQDKSSSQDNETESSQDSPSGMTLRRSTDDHGKDTLMWFQADSPVRTYLPQEKAQESMDSDQDCGPKWQGSWAKYNPNSYSWKTPQCSLLGGLIEFSETWPRWGTMQNGEFWALSTPGHLTNETESGLWPTPTASQARSEGMIMQLRALVDAGTLTREEAERIAQGSLTPKRMKQWPTPTVNDSKNSTLPPSQINHDNIPGELLRQGESPGGNLNPTWVEWLMGWPIGWTDLQPLAMDKFQQWSDSHGKH